MKVQAKFYTVHIIDARTKELKVIETLTAGNANEVGTMATAYLKDNNLPKDKVWKTTPIVIKKEIDV